MMRSIQREPNATNHFFSTDDDAPETEGCQECGGTLVASIVVQSQRHGYLGVRTVCERGCVVYAWPEQARADIASAA